MATRNIKLTGTAQWARVFEENRDLKGYNDAYVSTDGACTINVVLSDTEFAKLKAAGSMKRGSKTPDGDTQVKLERKYKTQFEWASGAPKVVGPDDEVWTYSDNGIIPNDSIVEVDVSVYDTKYAGVTGTRLDAVKIMSVAELPDRSEDSNNDEIPF